MSTAQAQPRTWLEAVREPVAVVARPVEWWEWLLAARDGWRDAHPRLMRGLAVATMVVVWLCIPVLVVVAVLVPHAAAGLPPTPLSSQLDALTQQMGRSSVW